VQPDAADGHTQTVPADKLLFTPGPLTTSDAAKRNMMRDVGSRDPDFIATVRSIRARLLDVAGVSSDEYTVVLIPGSGTYGIEAAVGSVVRPEGRLLVLANGAYGERMVRIAGVLRITVAITRWPEDEAVGRDGLEEALADGPEVSAVAVVHCETTTGLLNPVEDLARMAKASGRTVIVDAMSSFGAVPIDFGSGIDYLVSSSNKCIEGVPGFSFVIARRDAIRSTEGNARSVSLDLFDQWRGLESDGQFRFTPPTHAILAFDTALGELAEEGGVEGRARRYGANHQALVEGMSALGFRAYLPPDRQSYIISSYHYPSHPNFQFPEFYRRLSDKGMIIYPGKLSNAECFRIGTIGRIFEADVRALLDAIAETLKEMGVPDGA
jgi:2-aminoethylphosphonate-pyruvate transaminase